MADQCAAAGTRPVVEPPPVVHGDGREKHRGVGDAPGDDDISAPLQRLRDRLRSEIRIGGDDLISVDGLARLGKTAESIAAGELADIVAGHDRNCESAHAGARRRRSVVR